MQVTIHQAKTQLSKLIAAAERGEEVIIARRDKPVVRIVPEKRHNPRRVLGFLASHEVKLDGFFDPVLDQQIADDFLRFSASDPLHPDHLTNEDHEQGA
jgi:prevent-host-death family protein